MNNIVVNSRTWRDQLINDVDFLDNAPSFSTFFKSVAFETVRLTTNVSVSTNVLASVSTEILFSTSAGTATWTHPYSNWATEGFKVGDTIRVVRGGSDEDATISSIIGNVMQCNDPGFVAGLTIVSGTSYPDLEFRNTTVPTSVIFKYGIVPNTSGGVSLSGSNQYASWLDPTVTQAYSSGSLVISTPVALSSLQTATTEVTDSITCEYVSVTSAWIFEFEIVHTFKFIGYKDDFLPNLSNGTVPSTWSFPNSYRYVCEYLFGTNATDPNEYRIFKDNLLNGAAGWVNQNFTSGSGDYELDSIAYGTGTSLEASITNTITGSIKKNSGNWVAGQRVILTHMRTPSSPAYSGNLQTFEENFLFDQLITDEGAAVLSSTIIKNFTVVINGGDSTLLDYSFEIVYDSTEQGLITAGDAYFLGMQVGDTTGLAPVSDRMLVQLDWNTLTKNTDVLNLITDFSMNLYTSEKRAGGSGSKFTNLNTWNNRLHICLATFNLKKTSGAGIGDFQETKINAISGQVVTRNSTTGEVSILSSFDMPFKPVFIEAASTSYQLINVNDYRDLDLNPTAHANNWGLSTENPGTSYDAKQLWTVYFPFVIPWRTAQFNPEINNSFYDSTKPNDNLNFRTSNYDNIGDWDIYIRIFALVESEGVVTEYALYSGECDVKDFDVDPAGFNWTGDINLYNSLGQEVDYILENEDTHVVLTDSMATAGGLTASDLVGEFSIETLNSGGDNCRLNSVVDWYYSNNVLKPIDGETLVKVTQDVSGNFITIEMLVDYTKVDPSEQYTIFGHLQSKT